MEQNHSRAGVSMAPTCERDSYEFLVEGQCKRIGALMSSNHQGAYSPGVARSRDVDVQDASRTSRLLNGIVSNAGAATRTVLDSPATESKDAAVQSCSVTCIVAVEAIDAHCLMRGFQRMRARANLRVTVSRQGN